MCRKITWSHMYDGLSTIYGTTLYKEVHLDPFNIVSIYHFVNF